MEHRKLSIEILLNYSSDCSGKSFSCVVIGYRITVPRYRTLDRKTWTWMDKVTPVTLTTTMMTF